MAEPTTQANSTCDCDDGRCLTGTGTAPGRICDALCRDVEADRDLLAAKLTAVHTVLYQAHVPLGDPDTEGNVWCSCDKLWRCDEVQRLAAVGLDITVPPAESHADAPEGAPATNRGGSNPHRRTGRPQQSRRLLASVRPQRAHRTPLDRTVHPRPGAPMTNTADILNRPWTAVSTSASMAPATRIPPTTETSPTSAPPFRPGPDSSGT